MVRKLKLLIDSTQVLRKGSYSGRDLVLGQLNRKCFSSSMTLHEILNGSFIEPVGVRMRGTLNSESDNQPENLCRLSV